MASAISFLTTNKVLGLYTEHGCDVYVHINLENEFLLITGDHNHVINPNMLQMKNRILNETMSITKIYDEEIAKVHLSDEGAAELPTVIEYKATLLGKQFQPTHVVSYFESAIMSAVRHVFPAAKHSGCLFHFTQCIHRKIMSLGLGADYAQVVTIRQQCKELMGLSLMPICEVKQQFKRIREISSSSLDDLFEYFERQWIKGMCSPINVEFE
ncbi:unnamed protein product [Rotaria socialis]|uniref:MULE transposase domain-containing protein n=2 Tax=Rotaria socialis TaxID=392032 RepID=A0A820E1J7_9BILA|nr:unnamed protein product [Rotaria socialis]CAF4458247.1 unnamed protein product [Rotaria socialis]CAF4625153.1 unnamed protein product [Rotaria socialis]CAF4676405.1 unnamed protein product [Rotaria socialis]